MSSAFSRALSVATGAYAVFALVKPRHLGAAMTDDPQEQQPYDLVARTYGGRDLAVSAVGVFGRSPGSVRAAMLVRIGCDLADAALLAPRAGSATAQRKVLAATLGWATLNTLAVLVDRDERGAR